MKKKRLIEISVLASFLVIFSITNINHTDEIIEVKEQAGIEESVMPEDTRRLHSISWKDEQEEIRNEIFYGEIEELSILVQAEAGNQDELGWRYVADVVLNRVDSPLFPDTIHDVIYQINPVQFATTVDGAMGKAGYNIPDEMFQVVLEEYEKRMDNKIIYFRTGHYNECGKPSFKYGDHYFSTL